MGTLGLGGTFLVPRCSAFALCPQSWNLSERSASIKDTCSLKSKGLVTCDGWVPVKGKKKFISIKWVKVNMDVAEWARDIDVLKRRLGETRRRGGAKDDRFEVQGEMEVCSFWKTREGTWR